MADSVEEDKAIGFFCGPSQILATVNTNANVA